MADPTRRLIGMSERLENIKQHDLIGAIQDLAKPGYIMNLEAIINDVKWLIEQAERVEKLEHGKKAKNGGRKRY